MVKKKAGKLASCFIIAILLFALTVGGSACGCSPDLSDAPEFQRKVIADFSEGEQPDVFFESDGWSNGSPFNVEWDVSAVNYDGDAANLTITEKPTGEEGSVPAVPYYGGELRSQKWYHYGYYSAMIKPSAVEGTCTSFFTYTGPSELGADGEANPHDEIDIEFLGKDTTHVQFNFFASGSTGNEYLYKLGFDASKEYHEYGFLWEEHRITWYVDGEPVYRVTDEEKTLPSTPGRIMMNHWCGDESGTDWLNAFTADTSTTSYKSVSCTATPADPYVPPAEEGDFELSKTDDVALSFAGSGSAYTVTDTSDGAKMSYNVTYSGLSGESWGEQLVASGNDIVRFSNNNNTFGVTVKNNGTETVNVRLDVMDTSITGGNHQCINSSAYQNNVMVTTNLEWGGSSFAVEPGETDRLIVIYDGNPDKITMFLDSHMSAADKFSGNVDISEFNFCVATGEGIPEPAEPVEIPETPEMYDPSVFENVDTAVMEFSTEVSDIYTVTQNEDKTNVNVVYTAVGGSSYSNIFSDISVNDKNAFSVKVTNNADTDAKIRINMIAVNAPSANNASSNVYATYNGNEAATDTAYGGSVFTVAANSEGTAMVWYSSAIKQVQFMLDSFTYQDANTYSGDVTFSEFRFAMDDTVDFDGSTTPPATEVTDKELTLEGMYQRNGYTLTKSEDNKSVDVSYSGIGAYAAVAMALTSEDVAAYDTFSVKVENKGSAEVVFRVNMDNETTNVNYILSASYTDETGAVTDASGGGGYMGNITLPAGKTVTVTVKYDNTAPVTRFSMNFDSHLEGVDLTQKSGSLTLSEFKLSAATAPDVSGDQSAPANSEGAALSGIYQWDGYTVTPSADGTSFRVTYAGLDAQWAGLGCDLTNDIVGTTTTLTMSITNAGNADSSVKVDIGTKVDGSLTNKVTAAEYTDESGNHEITLDGSYMVTVAAGQQVTLKITFTNENITGMNIFADSLGSDYAEKAGNLVFGDFIFA